MSKVKFTSISGFDGFEGMLNMELLWTNASPSSPMAAQTIPLDLSKYKYIMVMFKAVSNVSVYNCAVMEIDGEKHHLASMSDYNNYRRVTPSSGGISVEGGMYTGTYGSVSSDNSRAVITQIYGIN